MGGQPPREELWVLGEIAGEAAHELRNALAVIAASASLIRSADASRLEGHVAKIERSTRIAQGVVDGLLALARGEMVRGASPAWPGADAPMVPLTAAVAEARRDVDAEGIAWDDDLPAALAVRGNDVLLSRMFRVLYENAIQAGARRIATRASASDGTVTVLVQDDGPGVPDEVRATLFDALVTTKPRGTGLGLALARRVARAHGGDVTLEPSERGAAFRVVLRA